MATRRDGDPSSGLPIKTILLIGLVGLAFAGAAQMTVLDDEGDADASSVGAGSSDAVGQVPAGVDSITRVDPAVLEEDVVDELYVEAYERAREASEEETPTDDDADGDADPLEPDDGESDETSIVPKNLAELREELANRTGLEPTAAEEIVVFQKQPDLPGQLGAASEGGGMGEDGGTNGDDGTGEDDGIGTDDAGDGEEVDEPYSGAIIHADWNESALVEYAENNSAHTYEQVTVDGVTVYRPENTDDSPFGSDPQWLAVLGEDEYVIGTPDAVNDTIAVAQGEGRSVGGDLLEAYEGTRDGFVRWASRSQNVDPEVVSEAQTEQDGVNLTTYVEAYNSLHVTAGSTYTTADGIGTETVVLTNTTDTARDVEDLYRGFISIQAGAVQNETIERELRGIDVERDGTTVRVTQETSVDVMVELLSWYISLADQSGSDTMRGGIPVA